MFIYFWEQVWSNETDLPYLNFETREISRRFWDRWNNRLLPERIYPCGVMEHGVDYYEY